MTVIWGLAGMLLLLAVGVLFSVDRKKIKIRTVAAALAAQIIFGALVLYLPAGAAALKWFSDGVQNVINASTEGINFVFAPLTDSGFVFAIKVLPVIIFIASLTSVLFYLGILQWVVKIIGGAFAKLFGTSVPESMNTAANIFLGHTEAPLMIRPYLRKLTQSEVFAVMVGGMATVSGSVLVGYSLLGVPLDHLIAAAFMAAPGALVFAKLIVPAGAEVPVGTPGTGRMARLLGKFYSKERGMAAVITKNEKPVADEPPAEDRPVNVIDAAARGAADGLSLALNIGAMLIAFISLIALCNVIIGGVTGIFGGHDVTLQAILGAVFAPVMFVTGVPWAEAMSAGSFVGQKLVLNEFVAFSEFGPQVANFSEKTAVIITFALTGFANFAGIAMQIGCLGSLAENQRAHIATLGLRAVLAGTLANLMSATIAGVMVTL